MRTITVNLYQFDELSDKVKEKARDWMRSVNAFDNDWDDYTLEDAGVVATHLGFTVAEEGVRYSGFFSQGDGASFTGSWSARRVDPVALAQHAPLDEVLAAICKRLHAVALAFPDASFEIVRNPYMYRVSHHNSVEYDFDEWDVEPSIEVEKAVMELKHLARSFMDWIYRQLEAEHTYHNSDECIDEEIRANEYEFTDKGVRA